MASRLPVVIAQHSIRAGRESQLEESLVAELIFTNGLDATLIHGIDRIETGSTDHLCLEGLMGDYALLCWSPAETLVESLNRLGIAGRLIIHHRASNQRQSIELAKPSPKKIYLVDLNLIQTAEAVMNQLRELLEVQNVRVVSLGSKILPEKKNLAKPEVPKGISPVPPKEANEPQSASPQKHQQPTIHLDDEEEWSHLDKLVDDLDAIM